MLAIRADQVGFASEAGSAIGANAEAVLAGPALSGIDHAYPPVPTVLAGVLPGGTTCLAVVAAVAAGAAVQLAISRLVERRIRPLLAGILAAAVLALPGIWFEATQNPGSFLGLAFLVVAIDGFIRFVARADTLGGFSAGLMLALAFLCDPIALVYAAGLAVAAPRLVSHEFRQLPGVNQATISVLLFPVATAMLTWAFFEWRATGSVYATMDLHRGWAGLSTDPLGRFGDSVALAAEAVVRAPLYLAVGALLFRRRRAVAAGYALVAGGLAVSASLGFERSTSFALALLTLVAIYTTPRRTSGGEERLLALAAATQIVAGFGWLPADPELSRWLGALAG
jgi:hypothetical protein